MKHLFFLFTLLLSSAFAQAPNITTIHFLPDLLGVDEGDVRFPLLSPDGTIIFYENGGALCLYTLDAATTQCYAYTEPFGGFGRYSAPVWSPDSSRIIFTESFFDMFRESDLWQLDVTTGKYTNLTDDTIDKMRLGNEDPNTLIDYLSIFSPTGELYFFRSRPTSGINEVLGERFSLELFKLNELGEAVRVSSLRPQLPIWSVFHSTVISPDGRWMALIVFPQDWQENPLSGVWLQSLETGQRKQVATLRDFPEMRPDWALGQSAGYPWKLEWVNTEHLLVYFQDLSLRSTFFDLNVFVLDMNVPSATALFDFRDFGKPQDSEDWNHVISPVTGFVRNGQLIYAHYRQGQLSLWSRDALGVGEAELLTTTDTSSYIALPGANGYTHPTVSNDGKRALILGYLLTLE